MTTNLNVFSFHYINIINPAYVCKALMCLENLRLTPYSSINEYVSWNDSTIGHVMALNIDNNCFLKPKPAASVRLLLSLLVFGV